MLLGMAAVGGPLDLALVGTGRREHALVLQRREDVRVAAVAVLALVARVVQVEAGGQHDGAHLDLDLAVLFVVQERPRTAGPHALEALGADGAVEAALGLGDRLLHAEAGGDLVPRALARDAVEVRHDLAGHDLGSCEYLVFRTGLGLALVPDIEQLLAAQVVVDGAGGPSSGGHRLDRRPGAGGGRVAAGEHAVTTGRVGLARRRRSGCARSRRPRDPWRSRRPGPGPVANTTVSQSSSLKVFSTGTGGRQPRASASPSVQAVNSTPQARPSASVLTAVGMREADQGDALVGAFLALLIGGRGPTPRPRCRPG